MSEEPQRRLAAMPLAEKLSIAVLPFANMSGDPEQKFFSDGVAEDVADFFCKNLC